MGLLFIYSISSFYLFIMGLPELCSSAMYWLWLDRINFVRSSLHGVLVWICDENSLNNTGMF